MDISDELISSWVSHFLWPFFRLGAFFIVVPVIGARLIPMRIRILLAFSLTVVLYPLLPPMPLIEAVGLNSFLLIFEQILIGWVLGFMVYTILQVFVLAGQTISMQMGLGFASMVDPENGVTVAVLSQWYQVLVTLIYLAINGHHLTLTVVIESFELLPVGAGLFAVGTYQELAELGGWLFSASLQLALPALTALLLVNLAFGVMTRAAPQLNIFALGFPITMLGGLIIIWLSYRSAAPLVEQYLNTIVTLQRTILLEARP